MKAAELTEKRKAICVVLSFCALVLLLFFQLERQRDLPEHQKTEVSTVSSRKQNANGRFAVVRSSASELGRSASNPETYQSDSKAGEAPDPAEEALPQPEPGDGQISESALRQIEGLIREKALRTSAQKKIGSQLIFAEKIRRGEPIAEGVDSLRVDLDINDSGSVLVDIEANNVTDEMLSEFEESGSEVINSFPAHGAIRAWVPLPAIEGLAEREDVISIRPAVKGYNNSGTIVSEGDATHGADIARSTYGVRGAGVKIGVLSDSVRYSEESRVSGELPEIVVLPGQAGPPEASGEGTAMLEIIHDLAPDAELFFATTEGGPFHFAENIRALRDAGCGIIVDDVHYFSESPFQEGIVAQAVDEVASSGVLYFTAAGNSGNKKSGLSGTWEGDFANGGSFELEEGTLHSFGSETFNTVSSSRGHTPVNLFWADSLGGSENDYDLFVLDSTGSEVRSASNNIQDGIQDPFEFIRKVFDEERIVERSRASAALFPRCVWVVLDKWVASEEATR